MHGMGVPEFRLRRRTAITALALLGPMLAGCSSAPSIPSLSSMFASSSAGTNSNASAANTLPPNFECPSVAIRQGAGTLTSASNQEEPTATNLRYQVSIADTARECRVTGNTVSMKVGVQGRVVIGPQGGPGQVDVPLRIAIVHDGVQPKTIMTKLERISVTVPPDDGNVPFTHIEDGLSFPMPRGNEIDSYVVYIGFDPTGLKEMEKKKPAPKPARPRSPTAQPDLRR